MGGGQNCPSIMVLLFPLFLQIFWLLQIQAFTDCSEFILGDCDGDANAVLMEFNTGTQQKCSAHCSIEENCQFYRFEENPSQGVNCYLFKEPFRAYVNHCNLRGGPRREGADLGSSCFSPSGDTCEVAQQEDCYLYGGIIDGTDSAPSALACEAVCGGTPECQMWTFETEENRCNLWDDAGMQCNKVFGPHSGTPEECGSTLL